MVQFNPIFCRGGSHLMESLTNELASEAMKVGTNGGALALPMY
jgi:methylmalonyl-CoA mutase N-terminal domain/subunit